MSAIDLLGFEGADYKVRDVATGREALIPAALIQSQVGSADAAQVEAWLSAMSTEVSHAVQGTDAGPFMSIRVLGS